MKFVCALALVAVLGLTEAQRFNGRNFFSVPTQRFRSSGSPRQQNVRGGADLTEGGSEYNFSWRHAGRHTKWGFGGAINYCRSLGGGWHGVSINSPSENNMINGIIGRGKLL